MSRPVHYLLSRRQPVLRGSEYEFPNHSVAPTMGFLRAYGAEYSKEKGFPQITLGATDEETGGAVTWAASALAKWGVTTEGGKVLDYPELADISTARDSGKFTSGLFAAVKKFQKAKGLVDDGIIGPKTWKALGYTGNVARGDSGATRAPATPVSAAPLPGPEESITDKVWFWPVAILVPTTLVIGGILLWPSKKKAPAAAPAAAPAV